ncbi:hypothetical protein V1514DRAFT_322607 [Lipomyces japonicus]|uniref:uncharacterized protein n=1 Tax=Lipomyces japonicus TaxID=56871 RepID=UPI0034CF88BA
MAPKPRFIEQPIRTLRYYSRKSPQYFFPLVIAAAIPVVGFIGYPLRVRFLYPNHEPVPKSYPLPQRERVALQGYDDE